MPPVISLILYLAAIVFAALAAFGVPRPVILLAAGLVCAVLPVLVSTAGHVHG